MSSYPCEKAIVELTDAMDHGLEEKELEGLIQKFPDCAEALRDQYNLWKELSCLETPVPSTALHARFYRTLNKLQHEEHQVSYLNKLWQQINRWLVNLNPAARWAFIAGIFVLGLASGFLFNRTEISRPDLVTHSDSDPEILFAKSLPLQSATNRLKEIQNVKEVKSPDQKILEALNDVLLHDPNINVRLSAIETLVYFAEHPKVREYLIQAIPYQDSPLVQLALADAMLLLRERRSSEQWQELFKSGKVETDVKMHLEETLEPLLY